MDPNFRRSVVSYSSFFGGLGVAKATSDVNNAAVTATSKSVTGGSGDAIPDAMFSVSQSTNSWLMDFFPDLVASGVMYIKDGHVFFYDLTLTAIVSFLVALFSLIFIVLRGVADLSLFFLRWKLTRLEKRQKKRVEVG